LFHCHLKIYYRNNGNGKMFNNYFINRSRTFRLKYRVLVNTRAINQANNKRQTFSICHNEHIQNILIMIKSKLYRQWQKSHIDGTEICKNDAQNHKITIKLELSKHTFIIEILVRLAGGVAFCDFFDFRLT